ncbi:TRAP transporter permease [Chloroflexota bacterium]
MAESRFETMELGRRHLTGVYRVIFVTFTIIAIGIVIFHVWGMVIGGICMPEQAYTPILLSLFLPSAFLLYPISSKMPRDKMPWYDVVLAAASMAMPVYVFINSIQIGLEGWAVLPPPIAVYLGASLLILLLEATRRIFGIAMAVVVTVFAIYPLFAGYMPGIFHSRSLPLERVIGYHTIGGSSIWGLPMGAFGRILVGFILFGAALLVTGGASFFRNFAMALLGHRRGGAAKVSILASALFGTMSGSAVANVVSTGAFTIPAMKRTGYPAYYAGAIEAAASTGGVLMPPVMGAVAFIMADILSVSYWEVCVAAFMPSVFYYTSVFIQSDFFAVKTGIKGLPKEECPILADVLKQGWFYLFSLFLLVFFLVYLHLEGHAPFYATAALLALAMIQKETRLNPKRLLAVIESTGQILVQLGPVLAAVGMIIGSLAVSGTAHGLAGEITKVAGGNLYILIVLTAGASFILGMGMTMLACYLFLALIIAPAMINIGVYPMAAHLFILYWGMISYITPPVAVAAFAAASLAGAGPWKTGWQAVRLGIVAPIVPFFFVLNPALVAHGSLGDIVVSCAVTLAGIVSLCIAIEGYMWRLGRLRLLTRSIMGIAGALFIIPNWETGLFALALIGLAIVLFYTVDSRKQVTAESTTVQG